MGMITKLFRGVLRSKPSAREQALLRERIQRLLDKWQPKLGVQVHHWNLRDMKKYWGSTNPQTREITFDSKLSGVTAPYLEITVVHELVHLLEPGHTPRFYALMDKHVPNWRRLHEQYAGPMTVNS